MLRENIDDADKIDESAEDITAADTAPSPKKEICVGVRCCSTNGRIMLGSNSTPCVIVAFQFVAFPIPPIIIAGVANKMQPIAAANDKI